MKQPAKALIARFGNLRGILDAPIEELRAVAGIGTVTPVALQIIKAAATLYLQQSGEGRDSLADPARLADFWRMRIGALQNEVFEVAYLDSALPAPARRGRDSRGGHDRPGGGLPAQGHRGGAEARRGGARARAQPPERQRHAERARQGAHPRHRAGAQRPCSSRSSTTSSCRRRRRSASGRRGCCEHRARHREHYPGLNDAQRAIVGHIDGPLLVIAGPGSGKTYSIVLRALNLLLLEKAQPRQLVLCTFTEKAAFEMRDRSGRRGAQGRLRGRSLGAGGLHDPQLLQPRAHAAPPPDRARAQLRHARRADAAALHLRALRRDRRAAGERPLPAASGRPAGRRSKGRAATSTRSPRSSSIPSSSPAPPIPSSPPSAAPTAATSARSSTPTAPTSRTCSGSCTTCSAIPAPRTP